MKYLNYLASTLFASSAAAYGSNIDVQDIDSVRFEGKCVLIDFNPGIELGTFNLNPDNNPETTLLAREVDQAGNEIVTSVSITFRMGDELSLGFTSKKDGELIPKTLGSSHLGNPAFGNSFRATLPLQLGSQVECSGTVFSGKK